ncbi:MAG: universal stress protein [Nitriliruptoraceae bacterium]|nr:universal stress protein [Nitriliruptoraceae bacterium]
MADASAREQQRSEHGFGRLVLVPVANPASARPLLRIAARIAAPDGGRVELLTTVSTRADADDHAHAWKGLAAAEDAAAQLGVRARGRVVTVDDPAQGVLDHIDELDASLVLMGWRGRSSTSNVFGRLLDTVVGRSSVPLAVVRLGTVPYQRVLLPVSADHLLPGGGSGLALAGVLADRLRHSTSQPTTLLRTGARELALPPALEALGDRVHHDPRRTDQAVAAFARAEDLVVAPVAPTVSGLRAATTHLAWAAPDATLLVAIDVGPRREAGLDRAVDSAGGPPPATPSGTPTTRAIRVLVTARLPGDTPATTEILERALRRVGVTDHLMAWWPAGDPRPCVSGTVTVDAASRNGAIGAVMVAIHDSDALRGAEITYDLDRAASTRTSRAANRPPAGGGARLIASADLEVERTVDPPSGAGAPRSTAPRRPERD